ncbi:hypothetical protein PP-LIT1_gp14 [Pseudomonas phage LIT1]|uniref:Uncharacterized protein n=1 Tax=Pseudomonas phage LIT1 TaxID=655098 RepID=C8ZKM8_9CAUD|nr:hypothetical protein PP-LIT1_gp14 [Pseudomonas phage LIT1]CAZ66270.1 hypothetical protein [Pseudomonas phage LIT1]
MPTDLKTPTGGTVTGRLVVDRDYLNKLLEVRKYSGWKIDMVYIDMTALEERMMAHMLDQLPKPVKKSKRIPKWEMPVRNHEINHLGKGPRNKFGGFN